MKAYVTPLRYPGGKRKLFDYTKSLLQANNLLGCTYIEPFTGGAGLALKLLDRGVVKKIILNDIDRAIYSFWDSLLYKTDELVSMINSTPVTLDEWYRQKRVQENKDVVQDIELAFSTFFLNRTNRSGILNGGVIGGKEQNGKTKLNCRFNRSELVERMYSIAEKKDQVQIFNMDAIEFLVMIKKMQFNTPDSFIFMDPPYYRKGRELYVNYYQHSDHKQLSEVINKELTSPWVVTYDNVNEIKELYQGYRQAEYDLFYSAQNKRVGKEVMIYSECLKPIGFE